MPLRAMEEKICERRNSGPASPEEFIITSHEHPDPDSLGSMLGLFFGLQQLGKSCRMVSADPPPANLDWPGLDKIEVLSQPLPDEDGPWIVVLDCEPARTGLISQDRAAAGKIINIDHHQTGSRPVYLY